MSASNVYDAVRDHLKASPLGNIEELIAAVRLLDETQTIDPRNDLHQHALYLPLWTNTADARRFLMDNVRLAAFVKELSNALLLVGYSTQQLNLGALSLQLDCISCNTVYAAHACGGSIKATPVKKISSFKADWTRPISIAVHRALIYVTVVISLLEWSDEDLADGQGRLLDAIIGERDRGTNLMTALVMETMAGSPHTIVACVGAIDNCSIHFPLVSHICTALLSLAITRRPVSFLEVLDPEPVTKACTKYLACIFPRLMNAQCKVEEAFAVIQLTNIVPVLYFLGEWKEAAVLLGHNRLPESVASIALNLIHSIYQGLHHDEDVDIPRDLKKFPELLSCVAHTTSLYPPEHLRVLENRPMSFAAATCIEVIARWAKRGIAVSPARIPASPPEHLMSKLTAAEIRTYSESVQESIALYQPQIKEIVERTPELAFILPMVDALSNGVIPKTKKDGILRGALLRAKRPCSLPGCPNVESEDGGNLRICSGACAGLARYCGPVHQKAHWKQHKIFCKRQPLQ